jgi:excisionase family DNA binding protein
MKPLWVDLHEAIALSGIKRTTLYRLIQEDRIKSIKVGKRRLFSVKSIEMLEDNQVSMNRRSMYRTRFFGHKATLGGLLRGEGCGHPVPPCFGGASVAVLFQ